MKFKLTKMEKDWILYDIGNSAFILLVSTIFPIFFNYLAEKGGVSSVNYLAYWGYAASISTLIVALLGPVLGTVADTKGYKKPIFKIFLLLGVIACAILGFCGQWLLFLIVFIIAKVGYSASIVFYDAMLNDVTTEERMDMVSSSGYAWGYIGSCIPFIVSLVVVLGRDAIGLGLQPAMIIAFIINALWWLAASVPLLKNYKQIHYVEHQGEVIKKSFKRLLNTFKDMKNEKQIFIFLLAFFFYIDGVYTIIEMSTAYGSALGLDTTGLLLALLVTQIVAFPCALFMGRISKKFKSENLITVCIIAYLGISLFAIQLDKQIEFWFLAICVGMFQGTIQALSRSYFAKIIPAEKSGEYFGLFDICGKGASFMGTALMSLFSQITGNVNGGVIILSVMFVIGLLLFRKSINLQKI